MFDRNAYMREWTKLNRVKHYSYSLLWRRKTRTKRLERMRKYAKQHRLPAYNRLVKYLLTHPSWINWQAMMNRCYKKTGHNYKRYGAIGIKVHEPWKLFPIYEAEFGWMKPKAGYTVDRIDSTGDYEPMNVRWLSKSDHARKDAR